VLDFIRSTARSLDIDEATARAATAGALKLLQKHTDAGDFLQLTQQLPGARELMDGAPVGGGALSGFMGMAAKLAGGGATSAKLEALSMLGRTGLSLDKARPFFTMLFDHLSKQVDAELLQRLRSQLEDLVSAR